MSFVGQLLKAGMNPLGETVDLGSSDKLVTAMGSPILGLPFGNAYFVDYENGSDSNNGRSRNKAFKTLSYAITQVTDNNNDVIFIDGYSTVVESAMITLSKNRVHIVGINGYLGHFGQGAKVQCTAKSGATNIATFKNTGIRNTFTGIKFISEMTIAESLYTVVEAGEYARYSNCEFYKATDLDVAGAAEILLNGDSAMFYNCTIGSTANEISGAIIRACVLCTATISGKKLRDCYFENCLFLRKGGNAANRFVYGANATDVERMLMFKDCTFFNNVLGAANPGAAVDFGAAQTEGTVFLKNCSAVAVTLLTTASDGTYVDGAVPTFATTGVSVAA